MYVKECIEPRGVLEPLPSLWSSLVNIFAAAALGEAEVAPIDTRNPCIKRATNILATLGYRVEKLSSTKLLIEKEEEPLRPLTHRLSLDCGLLVAELAVTFFAAQAPPGSRLILRALGSEYLLSIDTRELREVTALLGARSWSGGNAHRYLVIEKVASPPPRFLRLGTRSAALVASVLLALTSVPAVAATIRVPVPHLYALSRLVTVLETVKKLGYDVNMTGSQIRVERTSSTDAKGLTPNAGVAETLSVALYAGLCGDAKIELKTKKMKEKDKEELLYLLRAIGYEQELQNNGALLAYSAPRSIVYTVEIKPELIIPLAAQASAVGNNIVGGLKPSILEGLVSSSIERLGHELGAEIYLDEERLRVVKPVAKLARDHYSCTGLDPASCSLLVGAALAQKKKLLLLDADKAIGFMPFGPEKLQELGVSVEVQK